MSLNREGHGDREQAGRAALGLASSFSPTHPWPERERRPFRISEDSCLVTVLGATTGFHFRVTVAERVRP